MKQYVTLSPAILAGTDVFEAALIPTLVVGKGAVLAPGYLPTLRRRLQRTGRCWESPRRLATLIAAPIAFSMEGYSVMAAFAQYFNCNTIPEIRNLSVTQGRHRHTRREQRSMPIIPTGE